MPLPGQHSNPKRILLTSVFGPFGVDDAFGRKENIMELFHNQVTKRQGVTSLRFHHRSFGLYFLAENIDADVTVLDFPSRERFIRELKSDWDLIGISFIMPNFLKAQEMARLIRQHAPGAEIVLGGHGTAIEGVEQLIDCDHVARGEGIAWLRRHLGQDPHAPFVHPTLPSTDRQTIMGVPIPGGTSSLLVPGVGCVNGCNFCATSHFFAKQYSSFIATGEQLFETARTIADRRGIDSFFIMDENFLKDQKRAFELIEQMERHRRFFRFHLFSSAETILSFGVDNLVRLGASLVWIGFESQSRQSAFAKNIGVDARALVQALRDRGISVLASGILCMEHHTPRNMPEDIDFLVGLEPDMVQFMLLTPVPVTALYKDQQRRGILRHDLPYEDWHGQTMLAFRHPAFPDGEPQRWIERAFDQDYHQNSSSMYRMVETSVRGWEHLAAIPERDACLDARLEQFATQARKYSLMLPAIARHAVNPTEKKRAIDLEERVIKRFGQRTLAEKGQILAIRAAASFWKARTLVLGDMIQPPTLVTHYPAERRSAKLLEFSTSWLASGRRETRAPISSCS